VIPLFAVIGSMAGLVILNNIRTHRQEEADLATFWSIVNEEFREL